MRVFKNLFGDGSKIHASEIIFGTRENQQVIGSDLLFAFKGSPPRDIALVKESGWYTYGTDGNPGYINFYTTGSTYGIMLVINRFGYSSNSVLYCCFSSAGNIYTCIQWAGVMRDWKQITQTPI